MSVEWCRNRVDIRAALTSLDCALTVSPLACLFKFHKLALRITLKESYGNPKLICNWETFLNSRSMEWPSSINPIFSQLLFPNYFFQIIFSQFSQLLKQVSESWTKNTYEGFLVKLCYSNVDSGVTLKLLEWTSCGVISGWCTILYGFNIISMPLLGLFNHGVDTDLTKGDNSCDKLVHTKRLVAIQRHFHTASMCHSMRCGLKPDTDWATHWYIWLLLLLIVSAQGWLPKEWKELGLDTELSSDSVGG